MNSRYQLQDQISQGGVGAVFRAWDTRLQRTVAIKRFLAPELRSDGGAIDPDLMREATVLSAMQHPNIVSIYDVIPGSGTEEPCVVMEFLNGKDLEHAVTDAAITLEDFYKVAEQTLDALGNAHRLNLLHRDIKPANIQISWLANGTFICKFVDFGLARFFEKPSKQTVRPDGTVMGSVFYMAPEQLERRPLDGRTDLYSLGCVFYYLLSMHRPFRGDTMQQVINAHLTGKCPPLASYRPKLPPELSQWISWLMERHPADRPADAATALRVLLQIQDGNAPSWPAGSRMAAADPVCRPLAEAPAPGLAVPTVPDRQQAPASAPLVLFPRPASAPTRSASVRHSPLRWLVPAFGSAALFGLGLLTWQRWQATVRPSALPGAATQTANSILATSRSAAAAGGSVAVLPGDPSSINAPAIPIFSGNPPPPKAPERPLAAGHP